MDYARLNKASLDHAVGELVKVDADLTRLVAANGVPPLWARRPGFGTLVHIILEQQVSLSSAAAAFAKLKSKLDKLTAANFLRLSETTLRRCGFSRQKTRYCRALAAKLVSRELRLADIHRCEAARARALLLQQVGIGAWTADVYLLMVLRHPDVWPPGDIALIRAFSEIKSPRVVRSERATQRVIESWRPYRSTAARILWHDYLIRRGRI